MTRHYSRPFDDKHLAVLDIETVSDEEMENGGFPPWPTHIPVVVSILCADRDAYGEWTFALESVRFAEVEEPLERIDELLRGRTAVTFNGAGFDFPALFLAAQAARAFHLSTLRAITLEPRYASTRHCDLGQKYSNHGAARGASLQCLCEALSIPVKVAAHGDEVGELFDAGEFDRIVHYCEQDVASTLLLFAHWRAMEKGDSAYHAALTYQFVRWALRQGSEHLAPFTEVEHLDDLLSQSLAGQIDAAIATAALNAEWLEKRSLDAGFTETTRY